ncbi:hypothetical protein MAUB1S_02676 [Mycolicibacterium aubagnense]
MCSRHDLVPASVIVNASGHNVIYSRRTNPAPYAMVAND